MTEKGASRRETRFEQVGIMRGLLDHIDGLDEDTVTAGLDPIVRERLSGPRTLRRLSMRRARRFAGTDLFAKTVDDRDTSLVAGGADLIAALTVAVGVHILWQDAVRLVQRTDVAELDSVLGMSSREIAMRGRSQDVGVVPLAEQEPPLSLQDRIRKEGAVAWACWLSTRDLASARRLRVLTPHSVSSRLPSELPTQSDDRALRRLVVDAEMDVMIGLDVAEQPEREVA